MYTSVHLSSSKSTEAKKSEIKAEISSTIFFPPLHTPWYKVDQTQYKHAPDNPA